MNETLDFIWWTGRLLGYGFLFILFIAFLYAIYKK